MEPIGGIHGEYGWVFFGPYEAPWMWESMGTVEVFMGQAGGSKSLIGSIIPMGTSCGLLHKWMPGAVQRIVGPLAFVFLMIR